MGSKCCVDHAISDYAVVFCINHQVQITFIIMKCMFKSVGTIECYPYFVAISVNLVLFLIIGFTQGFVFETIDDYNMMMTISGDKTGSPYFQTVFFNSVYAALLSALYWINDSLQWYSIAQLSMVFASLVIILAQLISIAKRFSIPWWFIVLAYICLFVVFFLYPTRRMQFTSTSALLAAASCACLFSIDSKLDDPKKLICLIVLATALIALSLVERLQAGYSGLAFFFLGVVRLVILNHTGCLQVRITRNVIKRCAVPCFCVLLLALVFLGGHKIIMANGDNAEYREYDPWRIAYQDYPHPSYDQNPSLFESVGWDKDIYDLAQHLIFIDPAINKDSFQTLVGSKEQKSLLQKHKEAPNLARKIVWNNQAGQAATIGLVALFICTMLLFLVAFYRLRRRGYLISVLFSIVLVVLCVGLTVYVCMSGRWYLRAYQSIFLPCAGCLMTMCISGFGILFSGQIAYRNFNDQNNSKAQKALQMRHAAISLSVLILLVSFLVFVLGWASKIAFSYNKSLTNQDTATIAEMTSVEQYAIQHPNNVFIHDFSLCGSYDSFDPFRVYETKPSNVIVSGASYTYSGCYYQQLEKNGLDKLTGETLLDDNVFYVSDLEHGEGYRIAVWNYLRHRFGNVELEEVVNLDNNAVVYKYKLAKDKTS